MRTFVWSKSSSHVGLKCRENFEPTCADVLFRAPVTAYVYAEMGLCHYVQPLLQEEEYAEPIRPQSCFEDSRRYAVSNALRHKTKRVRREPIGTTRIKRGSFVRLFFIFRRRKYPPLPSLSYLSSEYER